MESKVPNTADIRSIIENIEEENYRYAFMYQFLVGGEISEVCGKYAPLGNDANEVEFQIRGQKVPAVLFTVKTARRKGNIRACAIPLDPQFEPWAKPLLDWFEDHGGRCPFIFGKKTIKPRSNQRYFQLKAEKVFNNFKWQKEGYMKDGKKVGRRFNPFRSSDLRHARRKNLKEFYHFNEIDLAIFGAWNEPVVDIQMKTEKEKFFSTMLKKDDIEKAKKIAEKYFDKLLRPIIQLGEEKYDIYLRERVLSELIQRREKAIRICLLIRDTNILSEAVFGDQFLKENMRTMLELFDPCESENDYIIKILSLASLFEVSLKKLRKKIYAPEEIGSIRVVETWLNEEGINYYPRMIETWLNIKKLRNMEPVHPRIDAVELKRILNFFGIRMTRPQNYSVLWDRILDRYRVSLEQWRELLNDLIA